MTQAKYCAPSTWDILLYKYAYNNKLEESYDSMSDRLLQSYFKAYGKEPSKIVYVQDKERLKQVSIWNGNYQFTQYVNQYYHLTYENHAEEFAIMVYERNKD